MTVVSGRQILGARERQEDSFRIIRQDETNPGTDLLILLADGMGGHVGGEVASRLVVEVFEKHCITLSRAPKPADRLVEALEAANAALRERIRREPELAGMGSTLVAAMKLGSKLYWLSVGDSVLYLLRDGVLRRLNADHSVYGELVEHVREGRLTQQEAETHPRRNALRSAIIGDRIALVDSNSIALQARDVILAASDGLETLEDRRIAELMSQPDRTDPKAMSADLLSAVEAAARPRQDNATVVVYRFDPSAKAALSTESLFRSGPAQATPPMGRLALAGGAGMIALALVFLVYVIGWGGRDVPPEVVADDGAVPQPEVPGPVVREVPREPTTIDRLTPEPETTLPEEPSKDIAPEGPIEVRPEAPTEVAPEAGRLIAPPTPEEAVPPSGEGQGATAVAPDVSAQEPVPLPSGPSQPEAMVEGATGPEEAERSAEDPPDLSEEGGDPLLQTRPRPRPSPEPAGE